MLGLSVGDMHTVDAEGEALVRLVGPRSSAA
jgi:hypothetical protein